MAGDGDDNVDLALREAAQQREKAARDMEEATIRDVQIIYEEERAWRIAKNQTLDAEQFGNIAPGPGRLLGDYARPVYNQGLSSVIPPPITTNNFELKQGLLQTLQNCCVFRGKMNEYPNTHLMNFEEIMNTFQYNGEIVTILDELFEDANQRPSESAERRRSTGVHQVDASTSVQVQLDAMAKEIRKLTLATIQCEPHAACDIYGRGHPTHECQASTEEVNVVGNYNFNAMGQKHPEVLSQMPAYAKFLKEILKKKRKIEKTSVVKLTKHCSAILQNKIPQKCGDIGSFTIPCSLGSINFDKSLYDSGASINLMPLSIYKKLEEEIVEIRYALISLQLADQIILIPEGVVEDVLVRVDKFVFLIDFIVVKMEENKEDP
ncbi:uncharacterized protein [Nicotiana tomentosiformis]|uniref:uncharacterized protein n=1 Tax=Nicotiana tomentosiformis TaxID=4098 RepID=UPI00388C9F4B